MHRMTLRLPTLLVGGVALLLAQPVQHAQAKNKGGAFVGGLVAGALLGGAAAAAAQPPPYYYDGNRPAYLPPPPPGYAYPPQCGYHPYLPCAPRPY